VFGHAISNPIGTSAGIDKHAEITTPLLAIGPAVVEVGGVTPFPQSGNPRPRVFRVPSSNALVNRYGLNSEGADSVAMRLRQRVREFAYAHGFGIDEVAEQRVLNGEAGVPPGSLVPGKLLAVQVAKNSFTPENDIEAIKNDYVYCVNALARYADIIVVNVSSPNTKGLRDLQQATPLTNILKGVVDAASGIDRIRKPAVMVKVSPDEDSDEQMAGIAAAVWESGVDGVIVGNTTKQRPGPLPGSGPLSRKEAEAMLEQGGFSGPQLFDRTVKLVSRYRKLLDQGPPPAPTTPSGPEGAAPSVTGLAPTPSGAGETEASIRGDPAEGSSETESSSQQSHPQPPGRGATTGATSSIQAPALFQYQSPTPSKVIFASGGITNGKQLHEVLSAGADLGMVYTALVYSGIGTISRIKDELREEIKKTGKR
jgi:dihydroorotate dehydrogenase